MSADSSQGMAAVILPGRQVPGSRGPWLRSRARSDQPASHLPSGALASPGRASCRAVLAELGREKASGKGAQRAVAWEAGRLEDKEPGPVG